MIFNAGEMINCAGSKTIVLVEDNPDDVALTRLAFEQAGIQERLNDFRSIQEVVETCMRNELHDVDLVLSFDGISVEIAVRIR